MNDLACGRPKDWAIGRNVLQGRKSQLAHDSTTVPISDGIEFNPSVSERRKSVAGWI